MFFVFNSQNTFLLSSDKFTVSPSFEDVTKIL